MFGQNRVVTLVSQDFDANLYRSQKTDKELILFYKNPFDPAMAIFATVAMTSVFPQFSVVNTLVENSVQKTLDQISENVDNKLHQLLQKTFENRPFILYYVDGQPVDVYQGSMDAENLIHYTMVKCLD